MTASTTFSAAPIVLCGVSHGYGPALLLDRVDLSIPPGEHAVVVGENGAGKSTLLRLLAGAETPDAGTCHPAQNAAFVSQEQRWPAGWRVSDVLDSALTELTGLQARIDELSRQLDEPQAAEEYDQLSTEFALRDGFGARARLDAALTRLNLAELSRDQLAEQLSGGEAVRLALAVALVDPAPVLLLDEPSNHLDAQGLDWLEETLEGHRGTVVIVSHDRALLRKLAEVIIEVDADTASLKRYGNGYLGYLREKDAERARWKQRHEQWVDAVALQKRKAEAVTNRVAYERITDNDKATYNYYGERVQSAVSAQIRNARERLKRLQENPVDPPPVPLALVAQSALASQGETASVQSGAPLVTAEPLSLPGRMRAPAFTLDAGDHVLLTGPNGSGKSTFLKALVGELDAGGEVRRRAGLSVGYLPQELPPPAHPGMRLLPAFMAGRVGSAQEQAEELLRLGLFRSADFTTPVGSLSSGQYRRLALARVLTGRHDVLLLDEPSNHLAPQLVNELQEYLAEFAGAWVVVSHDRELNSWFEGLGGSGSVSAGLGGAALRHLEFE